MSNNKSYEGEVVFFNTKRGYGFISWQIEGEKQKDIFVHFSDIDQSGFKNLFSKQKVIFKIGKNNNQIDKAIEVKTI